MIGLLKRFWHWLFLPAPEPPKAPNPLRYPAGTEIICPHCSHHIGTAKVDVYTSMLGRSVYWEGVSRNSTLRCIKCRSTYARRVGRFMQLHTEEGWR